MHFKKLFLLLLILTLPFIVLAQRTRLYFVKDPKRIVKEHYEQATDFKQNRTLVFCTAGLPEDDIAEIEEILENEWNYNEFKLAKDPGPYFSDPGYGILFVHKRVSNAVLSQNFVLGYEMAFVLGDEEFNNKSATLIWSFEIPYDFKETALPFDHLYALLIRNLESELTSWEKSDPQKRSVMKGNVFSNDGLTRIPGKTIFVSKEEFEAVNLKRHSIEKMAKRLKTDPSLIKLVSKEELKRIIESGTEGLVVANLSIGGSYYLFDIKTGDYLTAANVM